MMRYHAGPSMREEVRELLELSVQPLNLYGALLRRYSSLSAEEISARLADPVTDGLRSSLQDLLPALPGPYLDLASRVVLCNLLAQTGQDEEECLGVALLEHLALRLEPYLRAAEVDPDQARYLRPLLGAHRLLLRPVDALLAARRTEHQAEPLVAIKSAVASRRLADGG